MEKAVPGREQRMQRLRASSPNSSNKVKQKEGRKERRQKGRREGKLEKSKKGRKQER